MFTQLQSFSQGVLDCWGAPGMMPWFPERKLWNGVFMLLFPGAYSCSGTQTMMVALARLAFFPLCSSPGLAQKSAIWRVGATGPSLQPNTSPHALPQHRPLTFWVFCPLESWERPGIWDVSRHWEAEVRIPWLQVWRALIRGVSRPPACRPKALLSASQKGPHRSGWQTTAGRLKVVKWAWGGPQTSAGFNPIKLKPNIRGRQDKKKCFCVSSVFHIGLQIPLGGIQLQ